MLLQKLEVTAPKSLIRSPNNQWGKKPPLTEGSLYHAK